MDIKHYLNKIPPTDENNINWEGPKFMPPEGYENYTLMQFPLDALKTIDGYLMECKRIKILNVLRSEENQPLIEMPLSPFNGYA